MEIVYLVIGVIVGGLLGYLFAARKSVALRSQLQWSEAHAQDLLQAEKERAAVKDIGEPPALRRQIQQ